MAEKKPAVQGVKTIDYFCIGFGAIVGVGWAVSINDWMANCGGPVPASIGYLLALVLMVPIALCYCELVPMFPVAGGGMVFAYKAFRAPAALFSGWAAFGASAAIIPWEAIQITDMLGYLIPGIKGGTPLYTCYGSDIYLTTILIGLAFSIFLFFLNMRGFSTAARFQRILCIALVGTALLGAAAALAGGSLENLQPLYGTLNPGIYGADLKTVTHKTLLGGAFAILATAPFFLAGFETIPQGIESAGGNVKKVGKTVVLSVVMACLFYAFLLFCFGSGLPWQEFAVMPRPATASMFLSLYPNGVGRSLYWIIIIGAIAGLVTTWNGFFTASANLLMGMSRGRLLPKLFQKQNKNGVAVNGQIVCLIVSCVGPFLGPNLIDAITSFSATAFVLSWAMTAWSLVRLRITHPEMHRPYRIAGGIATGLFAAVACSLVFLCMFIPKSPFYVGTASSGMFLVWMSIGIVTYVLCRNQRKGLSREALEENLLNIDR